RGIRTGMFTEALKITLEEAGDLPISWGTVVHRIRERLLTSAPMQRPEVEGPIGRVLFDLQTVERTGVLPLVVESGKPYLRGGRIVGVHAGDEYSVMPLGAERAEPLHEIARARVLRVEGSRALVDLEFRPGHHTAPAGAQAFPAQVAPGERLVRVSLSG